jgi:GTP cyclohydrolase FolE2
MLDLTNNQCLPDTQASVEIRNLAVNGAGISGLKLPLQIVDVDGQTHHTLVTAEAEVLVAEHERGTHMSRLVETVDGLGPRLEIIDLADAHGRMLSRLGSNSGGLGLHFPWFVAKKAPVSGIESWLDVGCVYRVAGGRGANGAHFSQALRIPVTTLCPCSKSISRYGAHNQRSYVTVALESARPIAIGPLVALVEAQASCAIYALLKRADEKFVTEYAYDNPKFAEDLVRDIYQAIQAAHAPTSLGVSTENQESIHNHAAYAYIGRDPRGLVPAH